MSPQDGTVTKSIPRPSFAFKVLGIIIVLVILFVFIIPLIFPAFLDVEDFYLLLCDLLVIFILIKLVDRPQHNFRETLKVNKIQKCAILPLILMGLALSFFESGVAAILHHLIGWPSDKWLILEKPGHFFLQLSLVINVCITSPVWEELLFRGLLQSSIENRYGIRSAIFISSLLFSLGHLVPAIVFAVFLGSTVAGWVVYRTKSILSGIVLHAIANTIAVVYLLVSKEDSVHMIDTIKSQNDLLENAVYIVIGLMVVIGAMIWIRKLYRVSLDQ